MGKVIEQKYPFIVDKIEQIGEIYRELITEIVDCAEKEEWTAYHLHGSIVCVTMDVLRMIMDIQTKVVMIMKRELI